MRDRSTRAQAVRRGPRPAERAFLPAALVRRGVALLHQQCWCWGCDVRRPAGNLLLARGFERTRPVPSLQAGSRYVRRCEDGMVLVLWGFGVFVGREDLGGAFLDRYRFVPAVTPASAVPDVWKPDDLRRGLPLLHVPTREEDLSRWRRLFVRALDEIHDYERWVRETRGDRYRERCLREWSTRAAVPGAEMPEAWLALADACEASLGGNVQMVADALQDGSRLEGARVAGYEAGAIASARMR